MRKNRRCDLLAPRPILLPDFDDTVVAGRDEQLLCRLRDHQVRDPVLVLHVHLYVREGHGQSLCQMKLEVKEGAL